MTKPIPVIIFDLDGCLSDDRDRRHLLPTPAEHHNNSDRDYEAYHAGLHLDRILPRTWQDFRRACNELACRILIVTARPESVRELTMSWLRNKASVGAEAGYVDLSNVELLMRPTGNRTHSPLLKPALIEKWADEKDWCVEFIAAYDDRPDVLRAYNATGIVPKEKCWLANDVGICRFDFAETIELVPIEPEAPKDEPKTVPQIMRAMADTYEERNKVYGDNYKRVGAALAAMFPDGVLLRTPEDFNRWHLFELKMVKLTRFANSGLTHVDSIHDDSVYGGMIESILQDPATPIKGVPQ